MTASLKPRACPVRIIFSLLGLCLSWPACAQDAYEPDNTIALASNIFAGVPQSHLFTNWFDIDWVKFTTTVNRAYQIGMTNLDAGSVWGSLALYDFNTNLIASGDNMSGGGDIWLTSFLGTSGVYYAQAAADNAGSGTGPYWMVVNDLGAGDQHEPDNTLATASNLIVGAAHTNHTLHWAGDVDFVRFTNVAQRLYYITLTNNAINVILNTYDQDGQVLATDEPGFGGGDGVLYLFPGINGTNYASVAYSSFSSTGAYDLLMLDLGVPAGADPYEFDNTLGTASNIVVGTSQTNRSIHHAEDIDYTAFTAVANHYYRLNVTNVAATLDVQLALYDSTNGGLASADSGGSGSAETISYFLVSGGTYYARVRNYSGTMADTGAYHLAVTDLGFYPPDPYESDNTPATASNIVADIAQTSRTIHWGNDLDYIRFTPQAYHTYRVDATDVGASLNARLFLYAADGTTLLASSSTGGVGVSETVSYLPLSAGTNYILVRNNAGSMTDTGAYHVTIADLGAVPADTYEPDNSAGTAATIVVDVAQTNRTLHTTNDIDYVKVALQSNRYYRFETYAQQLGFTNQLILLGTNGSDVLAQQTNNLEYRITSAGDYYLRVLAYATNAAGSYTLRVKDLRTRYRWPLGGGLCSPAIGDDGRVYFGRTYFYALQPDGIGTQTWNSAGSSTFYSAPTIGMNGLVFMAAIDVFHVYNTNGTTNGMANIGLSIWYPSPALGPTGAVYMGANTNRFYSLNTLAQTNWTYPTTGFIYSAPAVDADGNIYFSCSDKWLRKLTSAGVSNWGVNLGQPLYASPALDTNGDVIVAGTGTVFLVSGTNGAILRTWQTGSSFDKGNSPVIGPSGTIYIVSRNSGRLYAFQPDGSTGSVWNMDAQGYGSTPAIGYDGAIYVGASKKFYAFNPNGTTSYVWNVNSDIYSSPVIDGQGLIYQNCQDGNVYAFYGMAWPTGGLANSAWPMFSRNARHTGAMGPPGPVTVTASDGISTAGVAVAWTTVTNAYLIGYEVWRGATNQPDTAIFLSATVTTNFTDTNAAPGQPYWYWVKSRNPADAGGFGGSDIGWRAMSEPADVVASDGATTGAVQVSWSASAGATNYLLWRNLSNDSASALSIGQTADTNYDDIFAIPGVLYYYWVQATNALGASAFSLPDTGWRMIAAPMNVTAGDGISTTMVQLAWHSTSGAVTYLVWRNIASDTGSASNLAEIVDTNYNDMAAVTNITYYYFVQSHGANGTNSAFSLPDTGWRAAPPVIGGTPPSAPAGLAASDGAWTDKVRITWMGVSNASGYEIYRSTSSSTSAASAIGSSTTTNYDDASATVGQLFYYWVKATNAYGASAFSSLDTGWRSSLVVTVLTVGACADYDGDRFADPAIYDQATGLWKIRLSSDGYLLVTTLNGFGGKGYASVAADYDGDRKADPAVYQETTLSTGSGQAGQWTILLSSENYAVQVIPQTLGGPGYSGMPADYDADFKADPGVYQRAQGDWKVLLSFFNYSEIEVLALLGGTGYRAVAADYDGDRFADPAVYEETTGVWQIKLSSVDYWKFDSSVYGWSLGGSGYIPVPADYDGDGFAEPAVRSETINEWIVMFSSGGYAPVHLTLSFD